MWRNISSDFDQCMYGNCCKTIKKEKKKAGIEEEERERGREEVQPST